MFVRAAIILVLVGAFLEGAQADCAQANYELNQCYNQCFQRHKRSTGANWAFGDGTGEGKVGGVGGIGGVGGVGGVGSAGPDGPWPTGKPGPSGPYPGDPDYVAPKKN